MAINGTVGKAGVIRGKLSTINKITGKLTVPAAGPPYIPYEGPYEVIPAFDDQILETAEKTMSDDVVVKEIPVAEVSNPAGGLTLTIG